MNIYLFNLIYSFSGVDYIKYISLFFSYIYVYILPLFLIFWVFYFTKMKMKAFSLLLNSSLAAWLISEIIKNLTAIARPFIENPLIIEKGFSFPSQHSAVMMALAVTVFGLNRKLGIWVFVSALVVGLSRIVLGVHYPIDVLIGWILGFIVGVIFIKLFKKI